MKSKKTNIKEPNRLNYRAWVNIPYKWITNEPEGTGGYWDNRDMLVEVIQLNLSKGTMRVRYTAYHGGKDTHDMVIQNLMQSTAKADVNGVEIFEDDLCNFFNRTTGRVRMIDGAWKFEISLGNGEFAYERLSEAHGIEVVGHYYEFK